MKIAVLASAGIGGTEKAAVAYAKGLACRGACVWFLGPSGPRTPDLLAAGVEPVTLSPGAAPLAEFLRKHRPEILHQHVPGYPVTESCYPVLRELGPDAPRLIETNVFGRLEDPEGDPWVRHRLFISQASAVQAFQRAGRPLDSQSLKDATVVYYPVEATPPTVDLERERTREQLGVQPGDILAVRVGQPSATKWRTWEAEALMLARRANPRLRLLLMQPSPLVEATIRASAPEGSVIFLPANSDFAFLRRLYGAADLMLHASNFGESFGYTIAEAMEAGLPLIVRSTPWGDNAQVELVENGVTGFVCATIPEMARRLGQLAADAALRQRLGQAGRSRILQLADPDTQVRTLEAIIEHVLGGPLPAWLDERREALLAFAEQFPRLEQGFSEPLGQRPWEALQWKMYSTYRKLRTGLRATINSARR